MKEDLPKEMIDSLPIFANMTEAERRQLVDIATTVRFAPGELVLRQDKPSQNLLIVLEGKCQVIKEAGDPPCQVVLAELGAYDHFGEMSFFHPAPRSATVRAMTALRLMRIAHEQFDPLIQQGSLAAYKLAYNILDEMSDRLRRMNDWVSDLLCNEPAEKQVSEWIRFRDKLFKKGWDL